MAGGGTWLGLAWLGFASLGLASLGFAWLRSATLGSVWLGSAGQQLAGGGLYCERLRRPIRSTLFWKGRTPEMGRASMNERERRPMRLTLFRKRLTLDTLWKWGGLSWCAGPLPCGLGDAGQGDEDGRMEHWQCVLFPRRMGAVDGGALERSNSTCRCR